MSTPESNETQSFADVLAEFESQARKTEPGRQREGTVISLTADSAILDIGYKSEGLLPLAAFREPPTPGEKFLVSVKGRDPEGYYELSLGKIARPTDWPALEKAFHEKSTIVGTVTAVVKGGLAVDVGVRAFLPASRSGARDAAELEKLVGAEIRCRVTKVDTTDEDVVVDRRIIVEEEERAAKDRRYSELKEGDTVRGTIRSLADYGAFVDIGGVDALLHVGEVAWQRIAKPADVLSVGQEVEARVLKIDPEKRRISLSLKQTLGDPWKSVTEKYPVGSAIEGPVTSMTKFGAFVQLAEGVEGMVHVSEISAEKRINHPQEVLKLGQVVQAQVLATDSERRTIRLSMKQLVPTSIDEYLAEHKFGDTVSGRLVEINGNQARVELGEGIQATCRIRSQALTPSASTAIARPPGKPDLSSLGNMLQAHWKGNTKAESKPEPLSPGQIRQFRITKLEAPGKKIEVELL